MKQALFAILLALSLLTPPTMQASAQDAATIDIDEGGPDIIFGVANYANTEIAITGQEPVIALVDMSAETQRDYTQFAGVGGQILGYLTTPLAQPPVNYVVPLPRMPAAIPVDLDNNGENDMGVQVFRLTLVSNLNGGSHLEQLDQWRYLNSYQVDDAGEITEGAFVVYAPDDQQGFPSGVGEDGLIFTADDPIVILPQGYTVARLAADGAITFDRSQEANIDVLEAAGVAYPDFADQGILESFNSLIDVLVAEYAFTDLRQLDWEQIRATYLPRVEAADAAQDVAAYGAALRDLAQTIRDAHVYVQGPGAAIQAAPIAANLGANVVELADGRFVVTAIAAGSPLEAAGVVFGTEIVSIDGERIEDRLPNVIYTDPTGTAEGQRLRRVRNLLKFPAGAEVELVYRLPDATDTMTATMKAGAYPLENPFLWEGRGIEAVNYQVFDKTFGYVTWPNFEDPIPAVEGYADFLKRLNAGEFTAGSQAPGIIIDMRSNGGGWDVQYRTMGSYFFTPEQPLAYRWAADATFDAATQTWTPEFTYDWSLSAPDPAAYFAGDVVILIDPSCGSSCEFFTAMLQSSGRATVVGQYATTGAGGSIKRAALPGGLSFQYPYTGVIFDGTNDLVLEAKGVEPDVRVPVTLESEAARIAGEDPVLAAGLDTLKQLAAARFAATTLTPLTDPNGAYTTVVPEGWNPSNGVYLSPTGAEYIAFAAITPPLADLAGTLRGQGIVDMTQQLVEERTANGRTWAIYAAPRVSAGIEQTLQIAITSDERATYAISAVGRTFLADAMRAAVLAPAIDAFTPNSAAQ
ncbi:MAG TPA: hypothetical protein DCL15_04110 [Chloroflexi bacterium]|nr:hypothetical protein [Chloroflexota bacterium]HHW85697.1 hypothetical protein [Chloroflexota bacterium]